MRRSVHKIPGERERRVPDWFVEAQLARLRVCAVCSAVAFPCEGCGDPWAFACPACGAPAELMVRP